MNVEALLGIIDCPSDDLRTLATVAGGHLSSFYRGAKFDGVDLRNEDLENFNLTGASFFGAIYDDRTKIDERFKATLDEQGIWRPSWKYDGNDNFSYERPAYLDLPQLEISSGAGAKERCAWNAVRAHGSADAFELFIHYWPVSIFARRARQCLNLIHAYVRELAVGQVMSGRNVIGNDHYDYVKTGEPPHQEDIDYEMTNKLHWHNRCKQITPELEALVKP